MRKLTILDSSIDIDAFDKNSKYIVKVLASTNLQKALFEYSEYFFKAAHKIAEYIFSSERPNIGKLDTYFFPLAFLYRHCIELGLKAIGFQYILGKSARENFVKSTRHNLSEILSIIEAQACCARPKKEMDWIKIYFADLSQMDRESDSFRYPFHIVREFSIWEPDNKFVIKGIFDKQTHIDLLKFINKSEAAYEIIKKWYNKDTRAAIEYQKFNSVFMEKGGNYYAQSVVGYKDNKEKFYPYTKAYLETANYLKDWMKKKVDSGESNCDEHLFLPMCYLYRNCVELSLKTIWFEEIEEDFQEKCKCMLANKHSIIGMWRKIRPYVEKYLSGAYINTVENYCMQIHMLDSDANKFRYPMSNSMQNYFSHNKRFDFIVIGDFLEALNNTLDDIDCRLNYINGIKAETREE